MSTITPVAGNFVGGQWILPTNPTGVISPIDPGKLERGALHEYPWSVDLAEQAVQAAREAQPAWAALGADGRAEPLRRFQALIEGDKERLARIISEEMGKPLADARLEMGAVVAKFNITLPEAKRLETPQVHPDEPKTTVHGIPLGVAGVIAPYNFPAHLTNGMALGALATGNTVILKPASNTPTIWLELAKLAEQAGIPAGVFNYVLGDRRIGQFLASSHDVDLVLFTGGITAGIDIKTKAAPTHKRVVLEMGGQGSALILPNAPIEQTAKHLVSGAFARTGQNCNGTRNAVCVGEETARRIEEAVITELANWQIGYQMDDGVKIGPLATDPTRDFLLALDTVLQRGATIVHKQPLPTGLPRGFYESPVVYRRDKRSFDRQDLSEIFGPSLGIVVVDSVEEGVRLINSLPLRLSSAVHAADTAEAESICLQLGWGQNVVNGPTSGASGKVAFVGTGWATYGGYGGADMPRNSVHPVNIVRI